METLQCHLVNQSVEWPSLVRLRNITIIFFSLNIILNDFFTLLKQYYQSLSNNRIFIKFRGSIISFLSGLKLIRFIQYHEK